MTITEQQNDYVRKLETRLETLQQSNLGALDALEIVLSFAEGQALLEPHEDATTVLRNAHWHFQRLLPFERLAFFLVDDDGLEFSLVDCTPAEDRRQLDREVALQVEAGTFGWALNQKRLVMVESQCFADTTLVLHSMATRSGVIGMFVGCLPGHALSLDALSVSMLSILLVNCSYALENFMLFKRLSAHNRRLEELVSERTAELQAALGHAESANQAKSQFLASMSHEIRTPINAVMGAAELLRGADLSAEERSFADVILSSSESLLDLINDILDLSRIEAGRVLLENRGFDLREAIRSVEAMFKHRVREKGLELQVSFPADIPRCYQGDRKRLSQVLINFAGNALKFTPAGRIRIAVTCVNKTPDTARIRIAVEDTGVGIPEDKQASIFEPFTQADASTTRKYGGTGLGLAISQQLIQLMGGEIGVMSKAGEGATFWFEVPLVRAAGPAVDSSSQLPPVTRTVQGTEPASNEPQPHATVLIVDDDSVNRMVARKVVQTLGHDVDVAESGPKALECIENRRYDLVFMDCQMPGMDGYETTAEIRRREDPKHRNTIIALTANAMKEDAARCLQAGMDDYIAKPIRRKMLSDLISRHHGSRESREE